MVRRRTTPACEQPGPDGTGRGLRKDHTVRAECAVHDRRTIVRGPHDSQFLVCDNGGTNCGGEHVPPLSHGRIGGSANSRGIRLSGPLRPLSSVVLGERGARRTPPQPRRTRTTSGPSTVCGAGAEISGCRAWSSEKRQLSGQRTRAGPVDPAGSGARGRRSGVVARAVQRVRTVATRPAGRHRHHHVGPRAALLGGNPCGAESRTTGTSESRCQHVLVNDPHKGR